MVDMAKIEQLADSYVTEWAAMRIQENEHDFEVFGGDYEKLSIFKSFGVDTFYHEELCQLSYLLTRSLRGPVNMDHRTFWSWSVLVVNRAARRSFHGNTQLFKDREWVKAFGSLVSLRLARFKGPFDRDWPQGALKWVNWHLMEVSTEKRRILGPLAFAVLEGLLRRKNGKYVTSEGIVRVPFCINDSAGKPKPYSSKRLNRINDSLRLFDQRVVVDRARGCPALPLLKREIETLYPKEGDAFDMIDTWRNDLVHGRWYKSNRVDILLNMICLLAVDELPPNDYDARLADFAKELKYFGEVAGKHGHPTNFFPLDPG